MLTETELLELTLGHLRSLALDPSLSEFSTSDSGCDGHVEIRWQGRRKSYQVLIKRSVRPSSIGSTVVAAKKAETNVLMITDQVTPPVAEKLRSVGIEFADAAGNAFLSAEGLLIYIVGKRYAGQVPNLTVGRLFKDKGLRVLFALLAEPTLVSAPYRAIAESAGVAHGTVGIVMSELKRLGFVGEVGGHRRLLQGERLLRQWVEAYTRTLRPKLLRGTYRAAEIGWWKNFDPDGLDLALGGEAGIARLSGNLVPQMITLYGNRTSAVRFQLQQRMKPDSHGNVEFLERFWHFEQRPRELTPPLLIYADLLATGDARCIEAAASLERTLFESLA